MLGDARNLFETRKIWRMDERTDFGAGGRGSRGIIRSQIGPDHKSSVYLTTAFSIHMYTFRGIILRLFVESGDTSRDKLSTLVSFMACESAVINIVAIC